MSGRFESIVVAVTLGLPVLVLPAGAAPQRAGSGAAEVSRAVRLWDQRFDAGDVNGLAKLYARDAVSMPFNAPASRGRAAIAADLRRFFAENRGQRHKTTVEELTVRGDLAVERSRYELRFRPKSGGSEVVERGKHIEVRRRIGGAWLIVSEIWNTNDPAAPAANP